MLGGGGDSEYERYTQDMGLVFSSQCSGGPGDDLGMMSLGGQSLFAAGDGELGMMGSQNYLNLSDISVDLGAGMSEELFPQVQDSEGSIGKLENNQDLLNARGLGFVPVLPFTTTGGSASKVMLVRADVAAAAASLPGSSKMSRAANIVNAPPAVSVPPMTQADLQRRMFPDKETITTDDWAGPLNFKVTPQTKEKDSKKAIYDVKMDKLFANVSVTVQFKVEMDYDSVEDLSQLSVRANLIFLDNDKINEPVLRCYKHIGEEQKLTDEKNRSRMMHILRPSQQDDIRYFQNETSHRCYLVMPVKQPEPGVDYTIRQLTFTCRNSCMPAATTHSSTIKRGMGILFVLYNQSGEILGRRMINLRICSAPKRDHEKEALGIKPKVRAGKRQSAGESEAVPTPKRANVNDEDAGSAQAALPTIRCVLVGPPVDRAEEAVSSSQESIISSYESDSKIPFRELVREMHWCLRQKNSTRPELREYAGHVFQALKGIQGLCKSARRVYDMQAIKEETERSPESGVGEGDDGME